MISILTNINIYSVNDYKNQIGRVFLFWCLIQKWNKSNSLYIIIYVLYNIRSFFFFHVSQENKNVCDYYSDMLIKTNFCRILYLPISIDNLFSVKFYLQYSTDTTCDGRRTDISLCAPVLEVYKILYARGIVERVLWYCTSSSLLSARLCCADHMIDWSTS